MMSNVIQLTGFCIFISLCYFLRLGSENWAELYGSAEDAELYGSAEQAFDPDHDQAWQESIERAHDAQEAIERQQGQSDQDGFDEKFATEPSADADAMGAQWAEDYAAQIQHGDRDGWEGDYAGIEYLIYIC